MILRVGIRGRRIRVLWLCQVIHPEGVELWLGCFPFGCFFLGGGRKVFYDILCE